MRPVIAIAVDPDPSGSGSVEPPYLEALVRAGAEPRSITTPEGEWDRGLAGLLVCGGAFDLPPEWYGQEPRARIDPPRELRSRLERALLERADALRTPVLGICNGAQLMAVVRGGTLVQDLAALYPGSLDHEQSHVRDRLVHPVELVPESRLARLLGETRIGVNSTHHQSIDRPGRGVRVVGSAPDGVVEAIEDPSREFWIGVQWHPERLPAAHAERLFSAFVEAAARHVPSPAS